MTGRRASTPHPSAVSRRDWKPPLQAVGFPAALYSFLTLFLLAASVDTSGGGRWHRMVQLATVLGREVIDHLGWMFGILIAIQLACLIAVIGGQIAAPNRREEATLRSVLAVFSNLPVVALSPAITLAAIAAFRVGELRGALFVIVPALLLTVFLSVFVGTFEPADELTRLRFAEERELRAQQQIDDLEGLPSARLGRTTLAMSGGLILLGLGIPLLVMTAVGAPLWPGWVYGSSSALTVIVVPLTVFTVSVVSGALKPTLDAFALTTSVVLMVAVFALQFSVLLMQFVLAWPLGLGMLIVTVFLLTEAVRVLLEARERRAHRDPSGYWRSGGLLSRVGTLVARQSAEKERAAAEKTIVELKETINRRVEDAPTSSGRRRREEIESIGDL